MPESALSFLLLYSLGLILALTVRPIYGLYTYIAIFYLHPPSRWWGDAIPDLRWSLLAAVVTLVALAIHRASLSQARPWYHSAISRLLILYVVWMWLQWFWVPSPAHLDGLVLFTKYLFLFYLIYTIVDNDKDFYRFSLAHVLGCAYFGWLVYVAPNGGRLEGVGGPGVDDANSLGMHLATGLMFASFLLLIAKGWMRWLVLFTIPLILNGIIQTQTRGAIVGLLLGALATVYLKPKMYRRIYWSLAVLAMIGFLSIANQAFRDRMTTMSAATSAEVEWDSSARSRIEIVKAQLKMFADYPLGVGHQGTAYLSRKYLGEQWLAANSGDRASHNTVMSVLVDQGVPGIALFVALGIAVTKSLKRLKKMDVKGLPASLSLYRTMVGGSLVAGIGAGMFAQNLKAEVLIWNLALLAALWQLARRAMPVEETADSGVRVTEIAT